MSQYRKTVYPYIHFLCYPFYEMYLCQNDTVNVETEIISWIKLKILIPLNVNIMLNQQMSKIIGNQ